MITSYIVFPGPLIRGEVDHAAINAHQAGFMNNAGDLKNRKSAFTPIRGSLLNRGLTPLSKLVQPVSTRTQNVSVAVTVKSIFLALASANPLLEKRLIGTTTINYPTLSPGQA